MSSPESTNRRGPARPTASCTLHGDETELFELYAERLLQRVSCQVRAPHQTVEDACSFAWMQLVCHQPDNRDQTLAWLTRVAVREVWTLTARERRADPASDHLEAVAGSDPRIESQTEGFERLTTLAALRPDERQLLASQAAGWSLAEIAEMTGHSWRAVCRRLKRARRHLEEAEG